MECPNCHVQNLAEDVFCSECGGRLQAPENVACARCGSANLASARFCQMCAAPLKGAGPPASRPADRPLAPWACAVLVLATGLLTFAGARAFKKGPATSPTPSATPSRVAAASPSPRPAATATASSTPTVNAPPLDNRRVSRLAGARASASSYQPPDGPSNVLDGDPSTAWVSGEEPGSAWIELDFRRRIVVDRVGIVNGKAPPGSDDFRACNRLKTVRLVLDGGVEVQGNLEDAPKMQFVRVRPAAVTRRIRLVLRSVYPGQQRRQDIIPEIEVWGHDR